MKEGKAASWKEQFQQHIFNMADATNSEPDFGTFADFLKEFQTAFSLYNEKGDAKEELTQLKRDTTCYDFNN